MVESSEARTPAGFDRLGDVVARNLRTVRTTRGISLSSLARDSGVARATLYQLEAGNGNPTIDTLFAVASVLGVALGELVTESEPPPVQIIRAEEAPVISGAAVEARLLRRFAGTGGVIELYNLAILAGGVTKGHEHPAGVFEHVLLTEGRILTGPEDDPIELAVGDYICFRADRPHMYEALDTDARATLLMHYPPAMSATVAR